MRYRIKIGIIVLGLFFTTFQVNASEMKLNLSNIESETESVSENSTEIVEVTELDLGDYSEKMVIGEKQLLEVTILPLNATETTITYSSANEEVATVNGMGRITAVAVGKTQITITCGKISQSFELEVVSENSTEIVEVTELDLGDYSKKMVIGGNQVLNVTVLPLNATETTITYSSTNEEVATVNGMGRITAVALGKTEINIKCGEISQSFELEVVEEEDTTIYVKDIEIANHENEVEVGKTITISGTVLPSDATKATIVYTSSDTSIATVSSTGEVKGISVGNVIITLTAGEISKTTSLKVKVATAGITLNKDYLILKPAQTYQLSAKVTPADAVQNVTYKSSNTSVATVDSDGIITAKAAGTATIIVSNGDSTVAVSVIVNESINYNQQSAATNTKTEKEAVYGDIVLASKQSKVNSQMLKYIYETKQTLQIVGEGYIIEINGEDIVNYNNEFYTDIYLTKENDKVSFVLNQGKELCGKVTLLLEEPEGKYLYLYNISKEDYQQIESADMKRIELTTAGEYHISDKKIQSDMQIVLYVMIGGVFVLLGGLSGYILVKRRYWFW